MECAVVTHTKLEKDAEGQLKPAGALDEPLIIRPTSETHHRPHVLRSGSRATATCRS